MNKIKVAVIGAGNMGSSHARAYAAIDEFELTGIIDRDPEKLDKLYR